MTNARSDATDLAIAEAVELWAATKALVALAELWQKAQILGPRSEFLIGAFTGMDQSLRREAADALERAKAAQVARLALASGGGEDGNSRN